MKGCTNDYMVKRLEQIKDVIAWNEIDDKNLTYEARMNCSVLIESVIEILKEDE